jgi:hypothetical protein
MKILLVDDHVLIRDANAPPTLIANTRAMAPGMGDPSLDLQPLKSRPFEGEVAVENLAHRPLPHPDLPERPIQRPAAARRHRPRARGVVS